MQASRDRGCPRAAVEGEAALRSQLSQANAGKQTTANQPAALASELESAMAAEAVQAEIADARVEASASRHAAAQREEGFPS